MTRIIGVQHRVKITADGASHPTRVAIISDNNLDVRDLKTEQDELDFILNELTAGDTVAMILGGSGDYLAYALHRRAKDIGARVMRIPSFVLKQERDNTGDTLVAGLARTLKTKAASAKTSEDHILLAHLARDKMQLFHPLADTDAALILARESWRALWESMQARMACEQRLRQNYIGRAFTHPDGLFPEGGIEKGFDALKASDPILSALQTEEGRRERELVKALDQLPVYKELFGPVQGAGPKIAGRIIASVIDIRRFETSAQLKAYMGVHVLADGRFPRRRRNEVANWHGDARQALFLLGEQFNRRPDSYWGKYLRQMKKNLREKHPVPVVEETATGNVTRYTDGHIHKMALWRTLTRFVEWLHQEWWRLETKTEALKKAA